MSTLLLPLIAAAGVLLLFVVAVGRAVVVSIIVGELKGALQDRLAGRIRRAAAELPPELAAEFEDEWLAELEAAKDRPLTAIRYVRGVSSSAVPQMRRDLELAPIELQVSEASERVRVDVEDFAVAVEPEPAYLSAHLSGGAASLIANMVQHQGKVAVLGSDVMMVQQPAGEVTFVEVKHRGRDRTGD